MYQNNSVTFEKIDETVKPKIIEKDFYCIPVLYTFAGKIEINT